MHAAQRDPGAAFTLASIFCAISLIPLMRGLRIAPKAEIQPADPADEAVPDDAAQPVPAGQSA